MADLLVENWNVLAVSRLAATYAAGEGTGGREWRRCDGAALAAAVARAEKRRTPMPWSVIRSGAGWGDRRAAALVASGSREGLYHTPALVCGRDRRVWASCSCEAKVLCVHVAVVALALGLVPGPEATPAALAAVRALEEWERDAVELFAPYARAAA